MFVQPVGRILLKFLGIFVEIIFTRVGFIILMI